MTASARTGRGLLALVLVFAVLASLGGGLRAAAAPDDAPNYAPQANDMRISQVYGGGGNSGATYTHDFIELFNAGASTINLSGYSVQYASTSGTTWQVTNLSGSIGPGQYYLIQQAQGSGGTTPLPTPDATGTIAMAATNGKVALVNTTTALSGSCPLGPSVVDFVGFGSANCYEGTGATPVLSNTTAALRAGGGCIDTDDNAADFTTGAPTPRNTASPTNSCGVDVPPTVVSTTPANGAVDVPVNTTITVQFSESVDVTADAFTVECPVGTPVTFSSNPALPATGVTSVVLSPDPDLPYDTICTVTVVATEVTDKDGTPQNMAQNYVFAFTTIASDVCSLAFTPIYDIQGSGPATPIPGPVTTQGVVVGDFEGPSPALSGFYLQDLTGDGDPATSDGIFVFNGSNDSVSLGDVVRVSGTAGEFQDQTQITSVTSIFPCGTGSVSPVDITLPFASADYLERYEGMLVRLPQTLYVTEHFQLGRFGQVVLTSRPDRLQQPTNVVLPGAAANALQAANNLDRIILDDELNNQNPDPIVFGRGGNPLSASNTLRGGDSATGIVGVLTYTWAGNSASGNAYRVRPIGALNGGVIDFQPTNPRPGTPSVSGRLIVTAANVLNYFNTFGTNNCTLGVGGGPTNCRGADDLDEFNRQWPKIVAMLVESGADVIGLMEIENDGYDEYSAIQELVDQLNSETSAGTYAFIDADAETNQVNSLGADAIKVGLIYKPASVTPVGSTAALNTTSFVTGGDSGPRNRPALAQAFEEAGTGERFIVVVNHLKSKGSACNAPDAGDGQGNCNIVRLNAATEMVAWLATDPTGTGDPDILIMGDLNSYAMEEPITAIKNAGYTDLIYDLVGQDAYSYAFDGQWGYLDHALATLILADQVASVEEWHVNADEPSVLDYNTNFKSAGQVISLYESDKFRSSDHDPVLIGLDLAEPNQSNLAAYGLAWHTGDGAWRLGSDWERGAGTADNDGVTRDDMQSWNEGQGEVAVTVTGPAADQWACLNAWLDYSSGNPETNVMDAPDGQFNDNEHVVVNLPIQPGVDQTVTWPLEEGVIDETALYNMRFRLTPAPDPDVEDCSAVRANPDGPLSGSSSIGGANGGEVEDHAFDLTPLAVTLASFDAQAQTDGILVRWETVSEASNAGFNLYRSDDAVGPLTLLAHLPSAAPGSTQGSFYRYLDEDVQPGQTVYYTLEDISFSGATTLHGPVSVTMLGPTAVTLSGISAAQAPLAGGLPLATLPVVFSLALGAAYALRRQR